MRWCIIPALLIASQTLNAQENEKPNEIHGSYELNFSKAFRFNITEEKSGLFLHIIGQGKVPLRSKGDGVYVPDIVKPQATIRFSRAADSSIASFTWTQHQGDIEWKRSAPDSSLQPAAAGSPYAGRYELNGRPLPLWISDAGTDSLRILVFGETPLIFTRQPDGSFRFTKGAFEVQLQFIDLKDNKYNKIIQKRKGPLEFVQVGKGDERYYKTIPNTTTGFSKTDSLQGKLTQLRTCYDVVFYNLDVKLDPATRKLTGSNLIRFRVTEDFRRLQVDLVRNLKISRISRGQQNLSWSRELNAVYIDFPETLRKGDISEILVEYEGYPQPADIGSLSGGFLWAHDRNGASWIQVVTQGIGASVWWPCKDHLSDEPDSMQINVTLPKGMTNISNGVLRRQSFPGDTMVRTEWFVSYPINTYNVTLNIGDYRKLSDVHINGKDTLALSFYHLPYNLEKATELMIRLKQMLVQYDKFIGPYPFPRDGLTVLEAPYPMEHQGAVSIGSINDPIWSKNTNMESLTSMIWHEVGHEWWGNNISMSDNADIWFHEGFTTYMEMLCHEAFSGRKEATKKLFNDLPSNKEKMVGEYDVNHFKLNTVYSKGALMIHTLRNIIGNDSRFFRLMKSMQHDLARRTVNGDTIIDYISRFTGLPLHPFFKQYIYYPAIPKLELQLKKEGKQQTLRYKWKVDVPNFWMPVRLLLPQNATLDLKATDEWQEMPIGDVRLKDIKVDKENFYVDMMDGKDANSK